MDYTTCALQICQSEAKVKGWCRKHYGNWMRNGDPSDRPRHKTGEPCPTEGCQGKTQAKGLCGLCRTYQRSGKDPSRRRGLQDPSSYEIENRYDVCESGCWEWNGPRAKTGHPYGRTTYKSVPWAAHRLAYSKWVGPIPEGLVVRHKCDNPPCINPDHLEIGTQADNNRDARERGRARLVGEEAGRAKLNDALVLEIRDRYEPGVLGYRKLAKMYGMSKAGIRDIIKRTSWTHI